MPRARSGVTWSRSEYAERAGRNSVAGSSNAPIGRATIDQKVAKRLLLAKEDSAQ